MLHARLWDNAPARDLLDRLPLTVRLQDVDNQEKVGYLPKPPLSADGMPEGDDPRDLLDRLPLTVRLQDVDSWDCPYWPV